VFIGLLSLSGLDYRGAFGCRRGGRWCFFGKTVGALDGLRLTRRTPIWSRAYARR
jgi:hypothetical protein